MHVHVRTHAKAPRARTDNYNYINRLSLAQRRGLVDVQSRKLKPRKLILSAYVDFSRKLESPKITRHTVYIYMYVCGVIISMTKELNFESRTWVMVVKHVYTLKVAISDLEISLGFPRSMKPVDMNVRLSGDSSP